MTMENDSPHLVGAQEIADHLKFSRKTIYRLIREKSLPVWFEAGAYRSTKRLLDRWAERQAEPIENIPEYK